MVRPRTRRAWYFRARGGPEVVRLETLDIPALEEGQLLGAHTVIDRNRDDFALAAGKRVVVFDTVGGDMHRRFFEVLNPGGLLAYINADPVSPEPPRADVRVVHANVQSSTEILFALVHLGARRVFRSQIGSLFDFDSTPAAYAQCESRRSTGKNVIVLSPPRS